MPRATQHVMSIAITDRTDPKVDSKDIQKKLEELIERVRKDVDRIEEPRFEALLETTAEVLIGLRTAFKDYNEKHEKAWGT